ncbi:thioredoxin domain-containing protein [Actinomycetospora sp. TBRC 11914]|uniref:thioredoxin domain-containing protein n=1 Tax=Actinomycetospora sp. TBRC 11914 TaxID=2729387 RepID=UPI00145DC7BE|nr:thioredoxin domain-containing protein [Actinomycetospora sp. TBRC 11914]NMO88879.1 thioredoxin domain-containing protein [Actinomycetospora sp. TBRC 11914]
MANRLAGSTSPYLRQHADNPIDWRPWETAAFDEARERGVPVLLSVGYSACHWCHVMAHESFSDPQIAAFVNEHFVAIKVDREERPDVDAVYMEATQAMTGQGGWPMTCFLTPEGHPFHCGTYYPAAPQAGMPSFPQLLTAVARAWETDGDNVRDAAGKIADRLAGVARSLPAAAVDESVLAGAVDVLEGEFDRVAAGFGGAPKFPPSAVLEFLLRHHERTGSEPAWRMATATHERMARGGLFDQLAGGFARYSVDAGWVVPHFEKMLYDNALLLRSYAHEARLAADRPGTSGLARHAAEMTAGFLVRDLRTPEGGFASALDADAAGEEGSTYVWSPAELAEVLGESEGAWAAELLGVTEAGTFEHGRSTLQMPADPDDPGRWQAARKALLAARAARPQPARDDKVVAAWNGLAITALVEGAAALGRSDWLAAARRAAGLLLRVHVVDGRLRRTSRDGVVGEAPGVLEDHAALAEGLLALHQATAEPRWLDDACALLDVVLERFAEHDDAGAPTGLFWDTADDAEALVSRPREITDGATPCGSSILTAALVSASVLAGPERAGRYRGVAEAALTTAGTLLARHARFAGGWATAAEATLSGPLQVAVVGTDETAREPLLAAARRAAPGGTVVVAGEPEAPGVPLLADRPLVDGAAAAYLCHGYVCDRPRTSPEELADALRAV